MKNKKNAWNTVTPVSKALALVMFVTFPFIGFFLGIQYQKKLDKPFMNSVPKDKHKPINEGVACTLEAKLCPDGFTYVGRSGSNCEFEKCPGE